MNDTTTYQRWMTARAAGGRARDVACELGVSEAELVASALDAPADAELRAVRLDVAPRPLFTTLCDAGPFKTITRNEAAVLEIEGTYANLEFFEAHGMAQTVGEVDLRIFLRHWRRGFWVQESTRRGPRASLQFFDAQGTAIHKAYLVDGTDRAKVLALVHAHRAQNQAAEEHVEPAAASPTTRPDGEVDVEGLQRGWAAMKDTHEFFGLTRRFGVTRTQALRLAGHEWTEPLDVQCLGALLDAAAAAELPIMFFVGNPGLIQIHTGPVRKIVTMDDWWNVMDPRINLHVKRADVQHAWLVRKPTADGVVTSVELYDRGDEPVLMVFGKRKPGQQELPAWREVTATLRRG